MKVIYNSIIPVKGYLAMAMWPFVFARKDARSLTKEDINHESIHCHQQIEIMITSAVIISFLVLLMNISLWWFILVPFMFYILYVIEFMVRCIMYSNKNKAYRMIATEQEAYENEGNLEYLKNRRWFAWISYY